MKQVSLSSQGRLAASVALVVAVLLAGCGDQASGDGPPSASGPGAGGPGARPPTPVEAYEVAPLTIPLEVTAVGSLRSPETTMVSADRAGILVRLNAPEGRWVERGHLLAVLDDQESQAALQVAEARYERAQAAFERIEPLYGDGVVSRQIYDDAVAELETAEGLLRDARTQLGKSEVRAPFSGVLGLQTAQLGQRLAAGEQIVQLTQINPLELIFSVQETDASRIRRGQRVLGRVGRCGEAFEGRVEAVDPTVDPTTRALTVQAKVPNPERRLFAGMSARVRVQVGERTSALAIPREALATQGTDDRVWVIGDDGTVQPRVVRLGVYRPEVVEVVSGLEAGERVVTSGWQKLRPGAPVEPRPWQATDNQNLALGSAVADDCLD